MKTRILAITLLFCSTALGADIIWKSENLNDDAGVSNVGTVVEAFAFTGDRDNNALPESGGPLEDDFEVNGVTFGVLNFTLGDVPDQLEGMTYDNGEFGHTAAEDGYLALLDGLAFQSGTSEQFLELSGLTAGQQYLVEFYYYHNAVNRSNTFNDGNDNITTLLDPSNDGTGGVTRGCFTADETFQLIDSTASTGSHFLNGYQLREIEACPFEAPEPPEPQEPSEPRLIGHWNFDGNTDDQSGMGNHGEIFGGVEFNSDVPDAMGGGMSAEFDGVAGTYIAIEHNQMMPVTSHLDFTLSMWVRADGASGDNADDRVFSEGRDDNNDPLFNLGTQLNGEDGRVDFFIRNTSTNGHEFSDGEAFDDEWHHIVWVDENNEATLYIDGEVDSTFDYTTIPEFEANQTAIGAVLRAVDCCNYTGSIDEVAAYSFALDEEAIQALFAGADPASLAPSAGLPGDFDGDDQLTAADIDALTAAIGTPNAEFDLNGDFEVTLDDRTFWVKDSEYANTWIGDSNLDGTFDTTDFVTVFTAGKFETGEAAGWGEGDWDGNGLFDSGDFVAAFTDGGFEQGPRTATSAVPEPTSNGLLLLSVAGLALLRRRC